MADSPVLIVGAGPTGLLLACDLARRGIRARIIETASLPFGGSRAKGLQPRTLEVFEDIGILDAIRREGGDYPPFRVHIGPIAFKAGRMNKLAAPSPSVPHPNLWLVPQWRTNAILTDRLRALGGDVDYGTTLKTFTQDATGVTATLATARGEESVRCQYLIGCDGGRSGVRKTLGINLIGEDLEGPPSVVADVEIQGLQPGWWHIWPFAKKCTVTLCALSNTNIFQLQAPLRAGVSPPDDSEAGIRGLLQEAVGSLNVTKVHWHGLYRAPHARMVDKYRVGRIFLAGDAAHVHPPSGGQGLNTGVQDAYNLAWKLAAVLQGAPDTLLETYEAERLPIAASMLGLSKKLFVKRSTQRGKETQQLDLHYRDSSLAITKSTTPGPLRAGDRAPDATGTQKRLFTTLQGPHWTLLGFGSARADVLKHAGTAWPQRLRTLLITKPQERTAPAEAFVDIQGFAHRAYGVSQNETALVLIRPDGYVGLFTAPGTYDDVRRYLENIYKSSATPSG